VSASAAAFFKAISVHCTRLGHGEQFVTDARNLVRSTSAVVIIIIIIIITKEKD